MWGEGMEKEQILFALLRNAVCGQPISDEVKSACTAEMLDAVYALANYHDLAHLAGRALEKLEVPECEGLAKCRSAAKQAIFRYMRIDHAYGQICAAFENAKIPYIPLKGSVLRAWYPEAWMRTSSDIDILVQESQLEAAVKLLQETLQFTAEEKRGMHDISLHSPAGVHFELHYSITEEDSTTSPGGRILSRAWEYATPVKADGYCYRLSDDLFYFYHVSHMSKHLINGGCGIRSFLDLWVMDHHSGINADKAATMLEEGGLLAYARAAEKLTDVWFEEAPSDEMTDRLALCVITGGVYGSVQNHVTLYQTRKGSKLQYAMSRIFLPYDTMRFYFPVLQKHKWLTPVFHIIRWFRILFTGGVKRSVKELKFNATVPESERKFTEELLQYLGL